MPRGIGRAPKPVMGKITMNQGMGAMNFQPSANPLGQQGGKKKAEDPFGDLDFGL